MKKPTFLDFDRPLITDMIIEEKPADIENHLCAGEQEGADAFGIEIEWLRREYRTEEVFRNMFQYLSGKPLYVTNYRNGFNEGMSEEARMDELKLALKCGATLVDLTGDTFAPTKYELTRDPAAVDRQRKLIDEFHALGGEVLMSTHVLEYRSPEEVLDIALEQQKRGVDIAKIVTFSGNEEEMYANMDTVRLLKRELKIPFLFLSGGPYCRMHRVLGPYYGVCMWLCVDAYTEHSSRTQPLLRSLVQIVRNVDLSPLVTGK